MSLRLLLDEHVEHETMHRLDKRGHDIQHVDLHDTLQKGDGDNDLAAYSGSEERIIVTYDDDFVDIDDARYHCVLFFENDSLSGEQVADIVHTISKHYPQSELTGLQKVGQEWL